MDSSTLTFYEENAKVLSPLYERADMSRFYERVNVLLHGSGRVLDVGCGEGRDVRALTSMGYDVFGCDASESMIRLAKHKAQSGINRYFLKAFPLCKDDEFLHEQFDLVYSHAMIMHMKQIERAETIKQMAALVKDDKYLVLSWCNRDSVDERIYESIDIAEINESITGNGMRIIALEEDDDSIGRQIKWLNLMARKDVDKR